ncbi:MAG: MiaB/RimO family radical SAM methylthiotransferase, partial [Terriglobales bacterium]
MPGFTLHNFGCRANQAEGAGLAAALARAGMAPAGPGGAPEWIVCNTCTVTAEADAEARRAIRRLHRRHPQARIAVTGCYAQRAPQEVAALDGVAMVAGRAEAAGLARRLCGESVPLPLPAKLASALLLERTRPVVKVQEGCDRRCAYCVVPLVRGASQSLPLGEVLERIQRLTDAGAQEVVISGINLGQWGQDLDRRGRLPELVRTILERTALPRLRLSSVEPMDWDEGLTALLASEPRLCRHAHLPLQSGSDTELRRMRRRYRAAQYAERALGLRQRVPEAAIGADVLVGFPDESETEFEETLRLVEALPLTYLHVFTFSSRPGTEAAARLASGEWTATLAAVATERAARLRQIIAAKRAAFLARMAGAKLEVVTLHTPAGAPGLGLSDNYLEVALP